jgi:endonuclease III
MKTILHIFVLFLISFCFLNARQISDRLIVSKFEESVKELHLFTDSAKTVQDCAEISTLADELEKKYAGKRDLLDRALYPDDFRKTFETLKGKLMIRRNDLGIIETQYVRITELEMQVIGLSNKVDSLSKENERLMNDVKRLSTTAAAGKSLSDSLQTVISQLRQNLKERDQLVFSLVDSLFLQYDKNISDMMDIEKQSMYKKLERRNVFTGIKKSIEDNLKFLRSTNLTPNDNVEIARQNHQFTSQWKGVGQKLANIYLSGKKKKDEMAAIDSILAVWSKEVDRSNWTSLDTLLSRNGIVLKPFSNGDEFTSHFTEYIDALVKNTNHESEDIRAKRFNTFNDAVWKSNLKPTWLPVLVESGKLTVDQKNKIEGAVDSWQSAVTPSSPLVYAVIIIVILTIILGLAMRFRKKPTAQV